MAAAGRNRVTTLGEMTAGRAAKATLCLDNYVATLVAS
jgi:hypothetical protein